ncbi:MAG: MazG nucleotide pyrophosphohydrolase domain-containing protein [Pseudonocardiaceae bacterium]
MQLGRLRLALGSDTSSQPAFVLAQAAKLAEEVGELQAEVLGQAGYQRATKNHCFTTESMSSELADLMICVAILASSHDIDLGKALASKIETINARHEDNEAYAKASLKKYRPIAARNEDKKVFSGLL